MPLLDLAAFVGIEEESLAPSERLPHTWDVTSDSLAAWVTIRWPADRLILLKSTDLPEGQSLEPDRVAEQGFLDSHFPKLASAVPAIEWVNLRSASSD